MIRLPSLHSHSGASSKEGDREERERRGRRGLMLLLGKMMRRLFLEAADRRGERGRGGEVVKGGGVDLLNPR